MTAPVFSAELQQRLQLDQYTAWAHDLSEPHLTGLLRFVGEVGTTGRGDRLLDEFDTHPQTWLLSPADHRNIRMPLQCIYQFCNNDHFHVEEAKRRFALGRSPMVLADLPEHVRSAVTKAAPEIKWDYVSMSEHGYELCGKDLRGRWYNAHIDPEGKLTFIPQADFRARQDWAPRHRQTSPKSKGTGKYTRWSRFAVSRMLENSRGTRGTGKYTQWAENLSDESLEGLLWLLGAVGSEVLPALKPVSALLSAKPRPPAQLMRVRAALDGIFRVVVHGERFDMD